MSVKETVVLGVALSIGALVAYPVLAEGPAVHAPAAAPVVAPAAVPAEAAHPEKVKESTGLPPKPLVKPPLPAMQDITLTGKIVAKSVVLVDSEGREIFLPYMNDRSAAGSNAPIDPKAFVGKDVTVVGKGRETGVNPKTGKKNVVLSAIESIKEGAATEPAKP